MDPPAPYASFAGPVNATGVCLKYPLCYLSRPHVCMEIYLTAPNSTATMEATVLHNLHAGFRLVFVLGILLPGPYMT
jgi:hypothetical protein